MNKAPTTVQQWIESLPSPKVHPPISKNSRTFIVRDLSMQSDDANSLCSSVESVLELRKPNPEEVLLQLGFGPSENTKTTSRIPARFLQPSKLLPHIDVNKLVEEYQDDLPPGSGPTTPIRTARKPTM